MFGLIFWWIQWRSLCSRQQYHHHLYPNLPISGTYSHQCYCRLSDSVCSCSLSMLSLNQGNYTSKCGRLFLFDYLCRWRYIVLHSWLLHWQVKQGQGQQDTIDNCWQSDWDECFIDGTEHNFGLCQLRCHIYDINRQYMLTMTCLELIYLNSLLYLYYLITSPLNNH